MSKVVAIMSMSLDGYIANLNDGVTEVFDWYLTSGDVEIHTGGSDPMTFKVVGLSTDYPAPVCLGQRHRFISTRCVSHDSSDCRQVHANSLRRHDPFWMFRRKPDGSWFIAPVCFTRPDHPDLSVSLGHGDRHDRCVCR
jgi:hypothetical protein